MIKITIPNIQHKIQLQLKYEYKFIILFFGSTFRYPVAQSNKYWLNGLKQYFILDLVLGKIPPHATNKLQITLRIVDRYSQFIFFILSSNFHMASTIRDTPSLIPSSYSPTLIKQNSESTPGTKNNIRYVNYQQRVQVNSQNQSKAAVAAVAATNALNGEIYKNTSSFNSLSSYQKNAEDNKQKFDEMANDLAQLKKQLSGVTNSESGGSQNKALQTKQSIKNQLTAFDAHKLNQVRPTQRTVYRRVQLYNQNNPNDANNAGSNGTKKQRSPSPISYHSVDKSPMQPRRFHTQQALPQPTYLKNVKGIEYQNPQDKKEVQANNNSHSENRKQENKNWNNNSPSHEYLNNNNIYNGSRQETSSYGSINNSHNNNNSGNRYGSYLNSGSMNAYGINNSTYGNLSSNNYNGNGDRNYYGTNSMHEINNNHRNSTYSYSNNQNTLRQEPTPFGVYSQAQVHRPTLLQRNDGVQDKDRERSNTTDKNIIPLTKIQSSQQRVYAGWDTVASLGKIQTPASNKKINFETIDSFNTQNHEQPRPSEENSTQILQASPLQSKDNISYKNRLSTQSNENSVELFQSPSKNGNESKVISVSTPLKQTQKNELRVLLEQAEREKLELQKQKKQIQAQLEEQISKNSALQIKYIKVCDQYEHSIKRQDMLRQKVMILERELIKIRGKKNNNFEDVLMHQMLQTNKIKETIDEKNQQIAKLNDIIMHNRRKQEEAINDANVEKVKYMAEKKQIEQLSEINLLHKENQIRRLRHALETMESKLQVAIRQNRIKDQFFQQHVVGRAKTDDERQYISAILNKYQIQFPVNNLVEKLLEEQKEIAVLKKLIESKIM